MRIAGYTLVAAGSLVLVVYCAFHPLYVDGTLRNHLERLPEAGDVPRAEVISLLRSIGDRHRVYVVEMWVSPVAILAGAVLLWVGGRRKRGSTAVMYASEEQAVEVHFPLSNAEHGTHAEREEAFTLSSELEAAVVEHNVGEFDGNEFGGGQCTLYFLRPGRW